MKKAPFPLGEKLKKIRELKGLTLKQVAHQAGVSESLVSQIENARVSPSIDTLLSLADYLEIDLDYLFRDYKRRKKARVLRREDRSRLQRGGVSYEQLSVLDQDRELHAMEAVLLELAPGSEQGDSHFGHPGRELGIILEGEGELSYGTETYLLEEGDSVSFASDISHVLRNRGKSPLKAIWIITPPKIRYFGDT